MNAQSDGMSVIRSQLCQAVLRLEAESKHMTDTAVAARLGEIERLAAEHGLTSLARVARSGAHAVHRPGGKRALASYLERMEDASGVTGVGDEGSAAILGSIALRLR